MMSLKSLHLKTLHSRNRKSRLRLSPGLTKVKPLGLPPQHIPANPTLPAELERLHRHMLAGIGQDVVWRRSGNGSALKSGFLIKWLPLFSLGRERGLSAVALF